MAITDNIVAYYAFDESSGNASDSSGNGNTLTNVNTVTYASGRINNGALFTAASTNYLTIADNAAFSFTSDFSLAGWIKYTSLPSSGSDYAFFGKFDPTGNQRSYRAYLDNSAGSYTIHMALSGTGSSATDKSVSWSPSTATLYHMGFVYTAAAGKVQFYVNGSQQGADQTGYPTSIFDSTAPFRFGDAQTGAGIWLDGLLDEWIVSARAFTSTDMTTLYNGAAGLNPYATTATQQSLTLLGVGA